VKMAPHVGHTVTVTGVVPDATLHGLKEDTKSEAKEHGIDKDSTFQMGLCPQSRELFPAMCGFHSHLPEPRFWITSV
jgi:hypothetical protein